MSIAVSFDTLQYANRLKAVGVPEKQAEVQAETFKELIEDNLATKRDLMAVEAGLKRDISAVEANLKRDIKAVDERIAAVEANLKRDIIELESKLVIKMGSLLVVGITVLVALMKVLHL